jgi:hypothetical protein
MLDDEDPRAAGLYAMWVAPQARGTGAGRAGFADTGRREPLGHSDAVVAVLERRLR